MMEFPPKHPNNRIQQNNYDSPMSSSPNTPIGTERKYKMTSIIIPSTELAKTFCDNPLLSDDERLQLKEFLIFTNNYKSVIIKLNQYTDELINLESLRSFLNDNEYNGKEKSPPGYHIKQQF